MSQQIYCNQCKQLITTTNYVKCYNCNANYHFSPCSPLSETTYLGMYGERKTSWKCHICKPRSRSPNTLYQAVVFDESNNKKQARTDDDQDPIESEQNKKFKESMSLNSVNAKICSVQSDVSELKTNVAELKTDLRELKDTVEKLVVNVNTSNTQIRDEIQTALATMTATLTTLVAQVKDLGERDKQREAQLNLMESRINHLEQQNIHKNIEIKNVTNKNITAHDVVKTIGTSLGVEINDNDINEAYRLKKKDDRIIVEFSTVRKKDMFMNKIKKHRIDAHIINNENKIYIYKRPTNV